MESESILKTLKKVPQQPQAQYDLEKQLKELVAIANKFGLYDASDFIKNLKK